MACGARSGNAAALFARAVRSGSGQPPRVAVGQCESAQPGGPRRLRQPLLGCDEVRYARSDGELALVLLRVTDTTVPDP